MDTTTSLPAGLARTPRARAALGLTLLLLGAGCDQHGGHNLDSSPIVQPESEAGVKAREESEKLFKLRQEQEAKSRRRPRVSPEPN